MLYANWFYTEFDIYKFIRYCLNTINFMQEAPQNTQPTPSITQPINSNTLKLEIQESYYISSKFKFHVIAPAIVDENDYYTNGDDEVVEKDKSKGGDDSKEKKEQNTLLLVTIKNNSVYSYVRDNKLGKVLGLHSNYIPKGISKHGTSSTIIQNKGLFVVALHKKKHVWAVFEMTSGTLTEMESKPGYITSFEHIIPYVSEDGNFVFLFDKGTLKIHVIDNVQDERASDRMTELCVQEAKNLKLVEYPQDYKDQVSSIQFFPARWRAMDVALGIKPEEIRVFTMAMLFSNIKTYEIQLYIARIYTNEKRYLSHSTKLFKFDPMITYAYAMYSLKVEDRDGDFVAVHCSEYQKACSRFYIVESAKIDELQQDVPCVVLQKQILAIEYQWIAIPKKYLVVVTKELELMILSTRGQQMMIYFKLQPRVIVPLPFYLTKRVTDLSSIQFFNVNTEGQLVLFIDKNVLSMEYGAIQEIPTDESKHLNENFVVERHVLQAILKGVGESPHMTPEQKTKLINALDPQYQQKILMQKQLQAQQQQQAQNPNQMVQQPQIMQNQQPQVVQQLPQQMNQTSQVMQMQNPQQLMQSQSQVPISQPQTQPPVPGLNQTMQQQLQFLQQLPPQFQTPEFLKVFMENGMIPGMQAPKKEAKKKDNGQQQSQNTLNTTNVNIQGNDDENQNPQPKGSNQNFSFIKTNFSEGDVNFDKADKTLIKDGKKLPQTLNLMGNNFFSPVQVPQINKSEEPNNKPSIYQPKPTKPTLAYDSEAQRRKEIEKKLEQDREAEEQKRREAERIAIDKANIGVLARKAGQEANKHITQGIWGDMTGTLSTEQDEKIEESPQKPAMHQHVIEVPTQIPVEKSPFNPGNSFLTTPANNDMNTNKIVGSRPEKADPRVTTFKSEVPKKGLWDDWDSDEEHLKSKPNESNKASQRETTNTNLGSANNENIWTARNNNLEANKTQNAPSQNFRRDEFNNSEGQHAFTNIPTISSNHEKLPDSKLDKKKLDKLLKSEDFDDESPTKEPSQPPITRGHSYISTGSFDSPAIQQQGQIGGATQNNSMQPQIQQSNNSQIQQNQYSNQNPQLQQQNNAYQIQNQGQYLQIQNSQPNHFNNINPNSNSQQQGSQFYTQNNQAQMKEFDYRQQFNHQTQINQQNLPNYPQNTEPNQINQFSNNQQFPVKQNSQNQTPQNSQPNSNRFENPRSAPQNNNLNPNSQIQTHFDNIPPQNSYNVRNNQLDQQQTRFDNQPRQDLSNPTPSQYGQPQTRFDNPPSQINSAQSQAQTRFDNPPPQNSQNFNSNQYTRFDNPHAQNISSTNPPQQQIRFDNPYHQNSSNNSSSNQFTNQQAQDDKTKKPLFNYNFDEDQGPPKFTKDDLNKPLNLDKLEKFLNYDEDPLRVNPNNTQNSRKNSHQEPIPSHHSSAARLPDSSNNNSTQTRFDNTQNQSIYQGNLYFIQGSNNFETRNQAPNSNIVNETQPMFNKPDQIISNNKIGQRNESQFVVERTPNDGQQNPPINNSVHKKEEPRFLNNLQNQVSTVPVHDSSENQQLGNQMNLSNVTANQTKPNTKDQQPAIPQLGIKEIKSEYVNTRYQNVDQSNSFSNSREYEAIQPSQKAGQQADLQRDEKITIQPTNSFFIAQADRFSALDRESIQGDTTNYGSREISGSIKAPSHQNSHRNEAPNQNDPIQPQAPQQNTFIPKTPESRRSQDKHPGQQSEQTPIDKRPQAHTPISNSILVTENYQTQNDRTEPTNVSFNYTLETNYSPENTKDQTILGDISLVKSEFIKGPNQIKSDASLDYSMTTPGDSILKHLDASGNTSEVKSLLQSDFKVSQLSEQKGLDKEDQQAVTKKLETIFEEIKGEQVRTSRNFSDVKQKPSEISETITPLGTNPHVSFEKKLDAATSHPNQYDQFESEVAGTVIHGLDSAKMSSEKIQPQLEKSRISLEKKARESQSRAIPDLGNKNEALKSKTDVSPMLANSRDLRTQNTGSARPVVTTEDNKKTDSIEKKAMLLNKILNTNEEGKKDFHDEVSIMSPVKKNGERFILESEKNLIDSSNISEILSEAMRKPALSNNKPPRPDPSLMKQKSSEPIKPVMRKIEELQAEPFLTFTAKSVDPAKQKNMINVEQKPVYSSNLPKLKNFKTMPKINENEDPLKIFSKLGLLFSKNEKSENEFLRLLITTHKKWVMDKKIPHGYLKKLWVLMIHILITSYTSLHKENRLTKDALTRIGAIYYLSKGHLQKILALEPKFKDEQVKKYMLGGKSKRKEYDPEKIFKKFVFKFNQDDFDLVKIIKYCRIILEDKHIAAHVSATCIYSLLNLLLDLTKNVWNKQYTFQSIPMLLCRDIINKLPIISNLDDFDLLFQQYSTKSARLSKNSLSVTGDTVIHYKDVNITTLLLYLINFTNHQGFMSRLITNIRNISNKDIQTETAFLGLILMLLHDKVDFFNSKREIIKLIKDRRHPDKVEGIDPKVLEKYIEKMNKNLDFALESLKQIEGPINSISLLVIFTESGLLGNHPSYFEKLINEKTQNITSILKKIQGYELDKASEFWNEFTKVFKESLKHSPLGMTSHYKMNKSENEIPESNRKLSKEEKLDTQGFVKIFLELSYLIDKEGFYRNDEIESDASHSRALFSYAKLVFYLYLKLVSEQIKSQNEESTELGIISLYYNECLRSASPFENQGNLPNLTIDLGKILEKSDIFSQGTEVRTMLLEILYSLKSKKDQDETLKALVESGLSKVKTESTEIKAKRNLFLNSLFPKEVLEQEKIKDFGLFNTFLEKILKIQSQDRRDVSGINIFSLNNWLGFAKFYQENKMISDQITKLHSKIEKKYSSVFMTDKKQNKNLIFIKGDWFYLVFPFEVRRTYTNHKQQTQYKIGITNDQNIIP